MTPTDEDFVLYADNALSPQRKKILLEAASYDIKIAETLSDLDSSRLPFKAAFEQQTLPPISSSLRESLQSLKQLLPSAENVSKDYGQFE